MIVTSPPRRGGTRGGSRLQRAMPTELTDEQLSGLVMSPLARCSTAAIDLTSGFRWPPRRPPPGPRPRPRSPCAPCARSVPSASGSRCGTGGPSAGTGSGVGSSRPSVPWRADSGLPAPRSSRCCAPRRRMDQVALYQFHRPDHKVPFAESVGALSELKDQGKIRHIGMSNVSESQLREAERVTAPARREPSPDRAGVAARPVAADPAGSGLGSPEHVAANVAAASIGLTSARRTRSATRPDRREAAASSGLAGRRIAEGQVLISRRCCQSRAQRQTARRYARRTRAGHRVDGWKSGSDR